MITMEIKIDLTKSVEENAAHYFELGKKAKKKLEGAKRALAESKQKLAKLQQEEAKFWEEEHRKEQEKAKKAARKIEWYEKFHWFFSSEGFLCIGGRDATTNEIVIKKHMEKDDLIFHTDAPSSPFFVVKSGQKAGSATLEEAAQATAIYSKAWKLGLTAVEVFSVHPEQVSKEAKAGESIAKGGFMIYGRKTKYHPLLECGIGIDKNDGRLICGPAKAIGQNASVFVTLTSGDEKKSDLAKKIKYKLGAGAADLDEIIKFLPGEAKIKK